MSFRTLTSWLLAFTLVACQPAPPALRVATALPEPRALPEFTLRDHHDRAVTRGSLVGQWSLVFFGYSHCLDICSPTLARLASARNRLPDALRPRVRVLFVSLDPVRDTPARLAGFVTRIHPDIVGVTGEQAQINALAAALAIHHQVNDTDGVAQVDHSGAVLVLDDHARLVAVITTPDDPAVIGADLAMLMTVADS